MTWESASTAGGHWDPGNLKLLALEEVSGVWRLAERQSIRHITGLEGDGVFVATGGIVRIDNDPTTSAALAIVQQAGVARLYQL